MPARKNRPDKKGMNGTQEKGHLQEVKDLCIKHRYTYTKFGGSDGMWYYEIYGTMPHFGCFLTYCKTLDRWGATHNMALPAGDSERIRYATAEEAVAWYKELLEYRRKEAECTY